MEQPNIEELQMTVFSLQKQISEYIGKVTDADVQCMKLQQEKQALQKELEEYRNKEIKEMDKAE